MNDAKDYDLVLVAGDVFDREGTPTSPTQAAADKFAACKTPTVVLAGITTFKSGIPQVLKAALARRNAARLVPLQREPLPFLNLGLTVSCSALEQGFNQYAWISSGHRRWSPCSFDARWTTCQVNQMLRARRSWIWVCGDQHARRSGDEDASVLFNVETSIQRRLVYSMAPEAQHINQGFVGAYTNVSLAENGEPKALTELRSVNFIS